MFQVILRSRNRNYKSHLGFVLIEMLRVIYILSGFEIWFSASLSNVKYPIQQEIIVLIKYIWGTVDGDESIDRNPDVFYTFSHPIKSPHIKCCFRN